MFSLQRRLLDTGAYLVFTLTVPQRAQLDRIRQNSTEFAERHRFLGRASEAQIESFHYEFKRLYHQQHLNLAPNGAERLRSCLADVALRAVQPFLEQ